jgi:6,7-dimethyl-8-ribityllumazine synthase
MASKGNEGVAKAPNPNQFAGKRVVVVKTAWNKHITDKLALGCRKILGENGVEVVEKIVPGAVELTFGIQRLLGVDRTVDAVVALGCVIKGGTPHFDYVCKSVTDGITLLNATQSVPIIFGVLTLDNEEQALERIGGIHGHKGEEAAHTALAMINFVNNLVL